ncbi:hypothetical protein [Pseudomonas aeruginosa]|uniref:hypothetical protein n=1 Tax=Pseudomonas aeruginosa TaxID=287 RepID=UPI00163CE2C9|nr:hypothetical protein [Pseudomonas aeruginosa]
MNWYTAHWQHMAKVRAQALAEGLDAAGIAKAIDQSIPCGRQPEPDLLETTR